LLLGLGYLRQNRVKEATVALALEALSNSNFVTFDLWEKTPYINLLRSVQVLTIQYYDRLLAALDTTHIFYNSVYEQAVLVKWWFGHMPTQVEWVRLRPIVQAILLAEQKPYEALKIVNQQISLNNDQAARLLRAWIDPDQYLQNYVESESLTSEETLLVKANILNERSLKRWFMSTLVSPPERKRYALVLAYRNIDANSILDMLRPEQWQYSAIANQVLNLFSGMPRDLPELDELMETIRTKQLNFTHPTRQKFKLTNIE
jgi:putative inorganic carbon (hco3(-)) transporter